MLNVKKLLKAVLNNAQFRTLLWTNSSPASSFSSQTISLDLSDYDCVEVHYRNSTGTGNQSESMQNRICNVGEIIALTGVGSTESQRLATTSTSGVAFENGSYASTYGGEQVYNSTVVIPVRIYGIKNLGGVITNLLNAFLKLIEREEACSC